MIGFGKRYPLVSIIILNLNGGEVTKRCLNSVLKTNYSNFEVILVDNGSSSKEREELKKLYKGKVKFIFNKKNLGYAGGNNIGAEKAKGKYLVFLNNDVEVPSDWLLFPIQKMEVDKNIAFLQPKIKWLKNKSFFEYAGGAGGYIDIFGYPFSRGRIFGCLEEDVGQYNDGKEIFWASGVALFCRKKIFKKLGMFDPIFFAYSEEIDLCFRAHRAGFKVIYYPLSTVFHLGGFTANRNPPFKIFLIHRNHLILMIKNLNFLEIILLFIPRIFMDFVAIIYYLAHYRSLRSSLAVIKAYNSLIRLLPKIINKRKNSNIKNFGYPKFGNLVHRGSILWEYFILGKKRYSEIVKGYYVKSRTIKIF